MSELPDSPPPTAVTVPLTPPQAVDATTAHVWPPPRPGAPAIILAHGAGTDQHHPHIRRHATDLAARGFAVATFDFAYTAAGRRAPDPAPRLAQAWRDVIGALRPHLLPGPPGTGQLVVGGRSMGGRIASVVAAAGPPDPSAAHLGIAGVVGIAYPLHPPGRPDRQRTDHWPALPVPTLLLCGSRDPMAPTPALEAAIAADMPPGIATLRVLQGADHSLRVRKVDGRAPEDVFAEVADAIAAWAADRLVPPRPDPAA